MGLLVGAALTRLTAPAAAAPPAPIQVTLDQARVDTVLGNRVTVRAEVTNTGAPPIGLVADLNVASRSGVYVDLEDCSSSPTRACRMA
jgi:hypothetical protein